MHTKYSQRLSPNGSKVRQQVSERYIPLRVEDQQIIYDMATSPEEIAEESTYEKVLKNELLSSQTCPKRILQYTSPKKDTSSPYSKSPMSEESQKLLSKPKQYIRKISRSPYKMLEAPGIQDDFYLHLVDWSSKNILAVGLGNSIYLWNASTNRVTKLCETKQMVTSVSWAQRGSHLAVGSLHGSIELWDVQKSSLVRTYTNHGTRVGALDWNSYLLSSGSRDRTIYHHDVRSPSSFAMQMKGHRQEVCGVVWSHDGKQLASGGNDNQLLVWDRRSDKPLWTYDDHQAAVKAIAWSPHQRGLLVSGGGTADRCIRFRDTMTGSTESFIDAGSQVCNLAWSKNVNEIVSTHGYSQNQIVVWKYPTMAPLATLTGHTTRVLYLSVSPDGSSIVTGAGDQTLRFWNVFPSKIGSTHNIDQFKGTRVEIR